MSQKKNYLIGASLFIFFVGIISLTLFALQQRQNTQSEAGAATTLQFLPTSSSSAQINKNVDDTVSLDLMIDPGNNLPSLVKLAVNYDPTFLTASVASVFTPNNDAFPATIEGPYIANGKVFVTVSIGSETTNAIQEVTKVGTLTFKAISPTTTSGTMVAVDNLSQVLSIASTDNATENVLASATPAYIQINGSGNGNETSLSLSVFMHGIGDSGDNANPTDSTLSNKLPKHEQRPIDVLIYNSQDILTASASGTISYASTSGKFAGIVNVGNIPANDYTIKVKSPHHLRKLSAGIQTLAPNQTKELPAVTLTAGDINTDNKLNILDYNLLLNCYSDLLPPVACN